uniref:Reverse transcriptase zinc-binding domain-containing protein n=1 Tax=Ananas comosus var. bracteatus TaxID=296719 RepID=A0A6V7QBC9_ANACO|nr:unnamed protein product [Ananas comosus var. bracteatus]
MTMFTDLLNSMELIDIPLGNQSFTWSNMQQCPTMAKLDRFLVSTEWDQSFPLTKAIALPRITYDHAPIVLSTADKRSRRLFRFEEVWLTREDFRSLVPKVLTKDNLAKRGWLGVAACTLCLDEAETVDHLFLTCDVTRALLGCLLPNKAFLRACLSIDSLWNECRGKRGAVGRKESVILLATWRAIWLERNRRIFDDTKRTVRQVLTDLRVTVSAWEE